MRTLGTNSEQKCGCVRVPPTRSTPSNRNSGFLPPDILSQMNQFPDTGPSPDGTRTADQWLNAMVEDIAIIRMQINEAKRADATPEDRAKAIGLAQKEAIRLLSDIARFGKDVWGITKEDIDAQGPY